MSHTRRSVLLVEDEALIRLMLAAEFEDARFEVHEAGSADEGVRLLSSGLDVSAIVTDVRMPGQIDGLGLVAWSAEHRPGLPIVVISGYVTASEAASLNPAIAAVLSKPYNPASIVTLVEGAVLGGPA